MIENSNLNASKDVLGQDLPPVFIKSEEINQKEAKREQTDYSKIYALPSIKTRYSSTLVDLLVILLLSLAISALFEKIGEVPNYVRGILFLIVFILYEPILVSFGATVGQLIMNIRVRSFKSPENKLVFHLALLRTIIKVLLGWLSFLTVTFNINRRAIHDFVSNSIMIANKLQPQ